MSKYVDLNDEWVGRHLFVDPYPLPKQDIALRIFDRMEAYLLSMNRRASLPAGERDYYPKVFAELQAIDYSQNWSSSISSFSINRSFTWLDWKQAEQVDTNRDMSFNGF